MKSAIDKETDLTARKNRELTAILEVSRVLTTSFDVDRNLSSAMSTLGSLLEMQRGWLFLLDPIEFKNEVLGVLSVDRIYSKELGGVDDDLRVLKIVASLIAQFIKLWGSYEKIEKEKEGLKRELKGKYKIENIIGQSDKMQEVFEEVHRG